MTLETTGKAAIASVGVWGSLLGMGTGLYEVVQKIGESGALPLAWQPYIAFASGIIALVGRLKASKKITSAV